MKSQTKFKSIFIMTTTALAMCFGCLTFAETTTGTLHVMALITPACALDSSNYTMNFGTLTTGAEKTASTTFNLTCTAGTSYTVKLLAGSNGCLIDNRCLKHNGTDILHYNIYKDASYATIWGDGTTGNEAVSGATSETETTIPITAYGKINGAAITSGLPSGAYTDDVQIEVSFPNT